MMNLWLIFITFLAVNLDFFFILLCLLRQYKVRDVLIGYLLGILLLVSISFGTGKVLALFLPEWVLGVLGVLPIYMALHDNDEDPGEMNSRKPIWTTFITYLAVCAGCNLSIFLPILTGLSISQFTLAIIFVVILSVIAVVMIKGIGNLPAVNHFMEQYSEIAMKVIYICVGLYVFWDSGLISHLIKLV